MAALSSKAAIATAPASFGAGKGAPLRVRGPAAECKRVCDLTGKKRNNGFAVSFSHKRNKKVQEANLHEKRFFWEREQRWVRLKVSAKAIRSVEKVGLETMAKRAGIDLYKLPYNDRRPQRMEWLAANNAPPRAKNPREPKNYAAINARAAYMAELRDETAVLIERERERRAAEAEAMTAGKSDAEEEQEAAVAAEANAEQQAEAAEVGADDVDEEIVSGVAGLMADGSEPSEAEDK